MPFFICAREWFSSTKTSSLVTTGRAVPATEEAALRSGAVWAGAVWAGAVWAGAVWAGAGAPVREPANRATGARTRARRNDMGHVSAAHHRGLERAAVCRDRSRVSSRMSESPRERIPSYLGAMTLFGGGWAAVAALLTKSSTPAPERYALTDLLVGGLATQKFTRLISKDGVTTPLRAPFTVYEGEAGSAEVNERPRDEHPQHTVGELLTCPFCLAPWVASAYVAGLMLAPRAARAWAATFSVVATSDLLQQVYARARTD